MSYEIPSHDECWYEIQIIATGDNRDDIWWREAKTNVEQWWIRTHHEEQIHKESLVGWLLISDCQHSVMIGHCDIVTHPRSEWILIMGHNTVPSFVQMLKYLSKNTHILQMRYIIKQMRKNSDYSQNVPSKCTLFASKVLQMRIITMLLPAPAYCYKTNIIILTTDGKWISLSKSLE